MALFAYGMQPPIGNFLYDVYILPPIVVEFFMNYKLGEEKRK
jgi:hypothetical protein